MREVIFKSLYVADIRNITEEEEMDEVVQWVIDLESITTTAKDREYIYAVVRKFLFYKKEIEEMISVVSHNHSLEAMKSTDRAVLYLGVFEILFGESFDVPKKLQ